MVIAINVFILEAFFWIKHYLTYWGFEEVIFRSLFWTKRWLVIYGGCDFCEQLGLTPDNNHGLGLPSHFSRVRLCATPETAAHQAPTSLGFSRQEHWSGLPFPSPMHEREKWKRSRSVVSDFATPWTAAYQAPPPMGFSRQEYWSGVPLPSPGLGLSYPFNIIRITANPRIFCINTCVPIPAYN